MLKFALNRHQINIDSKLAHITLSFLKVNMLTGIVTARLVD